MWGFRQLSEGEKDRCVGTHTVTLLLLSTVVAEPRLYRMDTRYGPVVDRISKISPQGCPSLIS